MDAQLAAAQELLEQLRHSQDPSVYVHPGLIVKRDEYGGLSLFVRHLYELDGLLAEHMEVQGHDRWLGIAPEELMFAIPRSKMIEAPQPEPLGSEHSLNVPEEHVAFETLLLASEDGGKRASDAIASMPETQHLALARRIADLWLRHQQHPKMPPQPSSEKLESNQPGFCANKQLLHLYLQCLPGTAALSAVLPALWVIGGQHEASNEPALQQEAVSARLALLQRLLSAVPAAVHALHAQLSVMSTHCLAAAGLQLELAECDLETYCQAETGVRATRQENGKEADLQHRAFTLQQQQQSDAAQQAVAQCWGLGICWSRAIHLWSGPTLVPLADFMNHSFPPNVMCTTRLLEEDDEEQPQQHILKGSTDVCTARQVGRGHSTEGSDEDSSISAAVQPAAAVPHPSGQQFICEAIRPLAPGTELRWVYNAHDSDAGWLMCYGFVPDDADKPPHAEPSAPSHTAQNRQGFEGKGAGIKGLQSPDQSNSEDNVNKPIGVNLDDEDNDTATLVPDSAICMPGHLDEMDAAIELCQELKAQPVVPAGLLAGIQCLLEREKRARGRPHLDNA